MQPPDWDDADRRDAALERVAARLAVEGLTRRQLAVVFLLSHGMDYGEVADTLGLSIWTIRDYAAETRGRLVARTNTHAVATALRLGVIS
jgi:DNA-binding NarL/FixJ family response regulator